MSKIRDIREKNSLVVNLNLIETIEGTKSYVEIQKMLFGITNRSKKEKNEKLIIELKNRTLITEKLEESARKFAGVYRDNPNKQWDISLYDINELGLILYFLMVFTDSERPNDGLVLIPWSNIICIHTFYDDEESE
jgi:hypothetical protein